MSTSEAEKKRKKAIRVKKYNLLYERLKKENPNAYKEYTKLIGEIGEKWEKICPFIGEEEAYGKCTLSIDSDLGVKGLALDAILWFTVFKRISKMISDELNRELKWLRRNRRILEMIVKEYEAAGEHR